jgi:hypothetical protein
MVLHRPVEPAALIGHWVRLGRPADGGVGADGGTSGGGLLFGDPSVDAILEDVQGESAAGENLIMEGAEVELVAELVFGVLA